MSGLVIVNENLKVSVGAARRSLDFCRAARSGQGRAPARRSGPLPASTVRLSQGPTGGGAETFPLVSSELSPPASMRSLSDPFIGSLQEGFRVGKLALLSVRRRKPVEPVRRTR